MPVPPAASGLWRILYLMTARITGLDSLDRWERYGPWKAARNQAFTGGYFEENAVEEYLNKYADRFDLFDAAQPWLQDPRLAAQCPSRTSLNKLVVGRATGNNPVWLSHVTDSAPQTVRSHEAAWNLLTWLYYGPSGQITPRSVRGQKESNVTAGPLRSRISFLPLGRSVYESLIAGLVHPGRYDEGADPDQAPWEAGALPDPLGIPPCPSGLSGPLTSRFRHAVLLGSSPDGRTVTDAWITWAWRQPSAEISDPYLIYDTAKDRAGMRARSARLDRAVWRDLDALLMEDTGSGTSRRPAVFTTLLDAPQDVLDALRVRAIGFDQDGQGRRQAVVHRHHAARAHAWPPRRVPVRPRHEGHAGSRRTSRPGPAEGAATSMGGDRRY